jgi:hypothetical protein
VSDSIGIFIRKRCEALNREVKRAKERSFDLLNLRLNAYGDKRTFLMDEELDSYITAAILIDELDESRTMLANACAAWFEVTR